MRGADLRGDDRTCPPRLRARLSEIAPWPIPCASDESCTFPSSTIPQKLLYELPDGNLIEGVVMRYHHGDTLCLSTQVGCRMGCSFCASTLDGRVRDL